MWVREREKCLCIEALEWKGEDVCVCVHVSMCGGRVLSVSACVCKRVRACVSERERALQKQISALISKNVIEVSIDQGKKT